MARTVTQLATATDLDGNITLIALCSDNTLWRKNKLGKNVLHNPDQSEQTWVQIEITSLPQT